MSLTSSADSETREEVQRSLTSVVHHGVKPLTVPEWQALLEGEGFVVESIARAPMNLLEPMRLIRDEGLFGALRFAYRVLRDGEARRRVVEMRRTFRANRERIAAVAIVAHKVSREISTVPRRSRS